MPTPMGLFKSAPAIGSPWRERTHLQPPLKLGPLLRLSSLQFSPLTLPSPRKPVGLLGLSGSLPLPLPPHDTFVIAGDSGSSVSLRIGLWESPGNI